MIPACISSLFCVQTKPAQWQRVMQTALRKLLNLLQARTHSCYLQAPLKSAYLFFSVQEDRRTYFFFNQDVNCLQLLTAVLSDS